MYVVTFEMYDVILIRVLTRMHDNCIFSVVVLLHIHFVFYVYRSLVLIVVLPDYFNCYFADQY